MADVNANIGVHIDTSAALAELKNLQRQLATFHSSVAKNSAASAAAQKNLQTNLLNSINATGKFSAQMGLVRTSTESFTHALEKNKLSMREYFRYAGGSTKTFGKLFRQEFDTIGKVAEERVKKMQTQYIKMGRDASGAMKAMAITPRTLDMNDYATKTALAAQKQALFNQLVKQGSTNLLNFGKNTQWAGRQLMVGFTVPLAYFGTAAAKTFMDLEAQAIKFKRVYGDMFTTTDQTNKALDDVRALAEEFTKYGVAVSKTMEMAASAAAMGKTGADLTAQVAEATRLAVLGGVEQEQALETTISLTNAFGTASEDLAKKINFLNSVENQTVVSIEDLTIAIPKAGPVVKQLGGDVEDLAFFLTAMKEGGINASEGANALKSGLASLINPTKKASEMLAGYGINIKGIVEANKGDIRNTVIGFAQALDTIDPLNRARAIEQLFGKFQFARLSTLFQNVTKDGTQASRVLQLAGASVEELAILSERELKTVENAVGVNFKEAVEKLKLAIAPIGETFLKAVTPIVRVIGDLLDKFNGLGDGTKKFIVIASTLVGIIGPTLLMTFGLLANGVANIIKLFLALRGGFLRLGGNSKILAEQTSYMNAEQMESATVAASLNQAHTRLTQSFTAETSAVRLLRQAYIDATVAAANFARANPGMMMPGKGGAPKKFARGTTSVPGRGNKDNVPAVLMPGEAVIPTDIAQDPQYQPIIEAMMNGTLQAFGTGTGDAQPFANSPQFQPKMDLSGPSAQVLSSNPSQVNRMVAGLPGFTEGNEAFAARSAALLAKMNARKNKAEVTTDGKVLFGGKEYNTTSQKVALGLKNKIDQLTANGYTPEKIISALDRNVERGRPMTASQLERRLSIGRGASTGTSAPSGIRNLAKQSQSGFMNETRAIKEVLKRQGIVLTPAQEKNLFNVQASHIQEVRNAGVKEWKANNLVADLGYVNNYLNTVKGKLGQTLLGMSDEQLKSMGIDRNELKKLQSGTHPTNARAAETLRAVARYDASVNPNSYQAKAVLAGLEYRSKSNFYSQPMKTLADIVPTKKARTKTGVVDGQTGRAKPTSVGVVGGGVSDRRQVAVGKGETILSKKTTSAIRSGKPAFIPGLGKIRIAGAVDGIPTGQKTGSTTVGAVSQSAQLSRAQLIAATEKISLKEAKRRIAAERKLAMSMEESTKAQMTTKEKLTQFSSKAGMGIGAISGLTIAASFAGGQVGEMAQKIMPFVFGLQGITMLLPMLANPWVAAVAGLTALVVGFKLIDSNNKKMAQKQSDYIDSISGTTDKMKKIGEITGKVGASEIMSRRREDSLPDSFSKGYNRAGQQFGTNFMGSDVGKQIAKGFGDSLLTGDRSAAVKQFALQLSAYVSDGVIDGVQAGDIARQLAVDFQDMSLYPSIIGQLTSIIGPDGANILTDPLKIRMQIIKEQGNFSELISEGINAGDDGIIGNEKVSKERSSAAAAAAASYSQSLELAKAQVDATNLQYEKDLQILQTKKNIAKTEQDRVTAQTKIDTLTDKNKADNIKLGAEIAKILKDQETAFDKTSRSAQGLNFGQINFAQTAFIEASKKQVTTKFAGTKLADQVPAFLETTKNLESKDLEIKINAIAASGTNPVLLTSLMKMFKGDEKTLNKQIDLGIATRGADETIGLIGSLGILKDDKVKKDLFLKINAVSDKTKFGDLQSTLTKITEMAGKDFDVNTYLKINGFAKLNALSEKLRQIQNVPDPITKTTQLENLGLTSEQFEGIIANWEYFMSLPETVRKNAITTYVTAFEMTGQEAVDAEINKRLGKSKGSLRAKRKAALSTPEARAKIQAELAARATKPQYLPGQTPPKKPKETNQDEDGGPGSRDTTLDDILNRLKMVREQSIKATGGVKELLRVTGGKGLTQFGGVMQDLLNTPGGINKEFLDFISQMDDKTRKIYLTEKNGIATLTDKGKALKEAYDEAIIGEYQYSQKESLNVANAQMAALQKLKAAGVPTAEAVQMVADAQLAVAINGADVSSEELKRMAEDAKIAADELERVGVALSMETAAGKIGIVQGELSKANDYFDKQGALIEQQRKASPAYKALTSEIDKQTQAIENANDEIDGYQSSIDTAQRDLEVNAVYGSRVIDNLNAQVDTLNRTAEINFDRPLANLSDESNILSNTLGLIDKAEEKINKRYDAQEEALSKISQLNSEIAAQEKQRLTLADALSQGDISAAAAAAQEMRATAAEAASRRSSGTLAAAREAELGAVSVSGMTRVQIEERQFQIGQQTFALEQQRQIVEANIQRIQDAIYAKEQLRLPQMAAIQGYQDKIYAVQTLQLVPSQKILEDTTKAKDAYEKMTKDAIDQLSYLGLTQEEWVTINTELVAAESLNKKIEDETSASAKAAKAILDNWTNTKPKLDESIKPATDLKGIIAESATKSAGILASWNALNKTFTTTHIINTVYTSSGGGSTGSSGNTGSTGSSGGSKTGSSNFTYGSGNPLYQAKMYGGKILPMNYGGMVPSYFAAGGRVGSDSVPAMLTPGEFVMNKAATKRFGPMLNQMNNSKFPSMIEDMTPAVYSSNNSSIVSPTITSVATTVADNSSTMYNYNIGISVPQSNASSNDIARSVISQIKYIDSQRIRGQK
jgi:TP901 family phage tail tape measure protein